MTKKQRITGLEHRMYICIALAVAGIAITIGVGIATNSMSLAANTCFTLGTLIAAVVPGAIALELRQMLHPSKDDKFGAYDFLARCAGNSLHTFPKGKIITGDMLLDGTGFTDKDIDMSEQTLDGDVKLNCPVKSLNWTGTTFNGKVTFGPDFVLNGEFTAAHVKFFDTVVVDKTHLFTVGASLVQRLHFAGINIQFSL